MASRAGAVLCLALSLAAPTVSAQQPLARSVLILDESGPGAFNPGYAEITRSFSSTLLSRLPVRIYVQSLDLNVFSGPQYERRLQEYLRDKYQDVQIGVLLAVGSSALRFALDLRSVGWSDLPIVFVAADQESIGRLLDRSDGRRVTGRSLRFSLAKSLEVARELVPGLRQIVLVGDPLEKQPFRRHFKEELPQAGNDFSLIDLTGLALDEVMKRVAALPDDSIILYTAVTQDGTGRQYLPYDAAALLAEVANRPMVVDLDNRVGRGGIGGHVVRPALMGQEAAQLAQRILSGEDASLIPIAVSDSMQPMFDWRQLRRWGISESRLPPGSEIRFRSPTAWKQYRFHILGICGVLMLQGGLIAWLLYEHQRRRRSEAAAHDLSGRLIRAQEEERSRLARELHDDVTQRLALLAIDAGREERKLPSAEGGSVMRKIREGLTRLSEDVHALSYRLHPSILEDLGLTEALKSECERFTRTSSIRLDVNLAESAERVPHDVALCLFRIAQEGLRNIARHADASRADIRIQRVDGGFELSVSDDGAGFDAARRRSGTSLGHASMRQRVHLLGGKVEIASSPGQGTTVLAWVPVREECSEPSARAVG